MKRSELEHLIRASGEIAEDDEIIIIGSQAILPQNWESRLVLVNNENTNGVTGYCLEVHDLATSKLIAGRAKDLEFVQELIRHNMIQKKTILKRLKEVDLPKSQLSFMRKRTTSLFRA